MKVLLITLFLIVILQRITHVKRYFDMKCIPLHFRENHSAFEAIRYDNKIQISKDPNHKVYLPHIQFLQYQALFFPGPTNNDFKKQCTYIYNFIDCRSSWNAKYDCTVAPIERDKECAVDCHDEYGISARYGINQHFITFNQIFIFILDSHFLLQIIELILILIIKAHPYRNMGI